MTWKGGVYKELLWRAAKATTIVEFNKAMDALKGYNVKAYEWLKNIPAEHWSRSHFTGITLAKYYVKYNVLQKCLGV